MSVKRFSKIIRNRILILKKIVLLYFFQNKCIKCYQLIQRSVNHISVITNSICHIQITEYYWQ